LPGSFRFGSLALLFESYGSLQLVIGRSLLSGCIARWDCENAGE
jgi:hypothetical protein